MELCRVGETFVAPMEARHDVAACVHHALRSYFPFGEDAIVGKAEDAQGKTLETFRFPFPPVESILEFVHMRVEGVQQESGWTHILLSIDVTLPQEHATQAHLVQRALRFTLYKAIVLPTQMLASG